MILTPHIGTYTQEIYVRMDVEAAQQCGALFDLLKGSLREYAGMLCMPAHFLEDEMEPCGRLANL